MILLFGCAHVRLVVKDLLIFYRNLMVKLFFCKILMELGREWPDMVLANKC